MPRQERRLAIGIMQRTERCESRIVPYDVVEARNSLVFPHVAEGLDANKMQAVRIAQFIGDAYH